MNFASTGEFIRAARKQAKLTQAELAQRLRMSRATLSRIENGTIEELGIRKFAQLCDRLGLELAVRPRRPPTLQEAYEQNRRDRQEAFRATDEVLAKLKPDARG
ncbi:MAG TPA: helix-turn-helix transcriptional regulator [Opitutaceae bacterium]